MLLAAAADVGAALADHQALDGVATAWAGLSGAAENFEKGSIAAGFAFKGIEICSTAAKGGSRVFESLSQRLANRAVQLNRLVGSQCGGIAQRMQPGFPQGFIHVDVAHSGNESLIQQ